MSGGTVWADNFWADNFWAEGFWEGAVGQGHSGYPIPIKRTKEKSYRLREDNLREIVERATELQAHLDRIKASITEAQYVAERVPIRLMSGKYARAQVSMLNTVLDDLKAYCDLFDVGSETLPQLLVIEDRISRVIDLSVHKSITVAAKEMQRMVDEIGKSIGTQ